MYYGTTVLSTTRLISNPFSTMHVDLLSIAVVSSSSALWKELGLSSLHCRRKFHFAELTYKCQITRSSLSLIPVLSPHPPPQHTDKTLVQDDLWATCICIHWCFPVALSTCLITRIWIPRGIFKIRVLFRILTHTMTSECLIIHDATYKFWIYPLNLLQTKLYFRMNSLTPQKSVKISTSVALRWKKQEKWNTGSEFLAEHTPQCLLAPVHIPYVGQDLIRNVNVLGLVDEWSPFLYVVYHFFLVWDLNQVSVQQVNIS